MADVSLTNRLVFIPFCLELERQLVETLHVLLCSSFSKTTTKEHKQYTF